MYGSILAPCQREVFGTPEDIDSGMRHHIDYCDECQEILAEGEDNG